MGKLGKSLTMSGIFTLYIMCFYFGIGVLLTAVKGDDVVAFAGQSLIVAVVLFACISFALHEFFGFVEERNRIQDEERKRIDNTTNPDSDHNRDGRS